MSIQSILTSYWSRKDDASASKDISNGSTREPVTQTKESAIVSKDTDHGITLEPHTSNILPKPSTPPKPMNESGMILDTISEASRENSEYGSRHPSVVQMDADNNGEVTRRLSNWWNPEQKKDDEAWVDWSLQYRRMSSVVSYVYNPEEDNGPKTPALHEHDKPVEPSASSSTWLGWLWQKKTDDDVDEDEDTAAYQVYKASKYAIENSKDPTHYASRYSLIEDTIHHQKQVELAVSDTPSENLPVRYNKRKRPLTANEVQELTMVAVDSSTESHVLPTIDENLRTITWRTKMRLFMEDMVWQGNSSENHLYLKRGGEIALRRKNKMNKVVIIGIHSFLPIKMVKSLIGQLTGNSILFVKEATKQVQEWLRRDYPEYDYNDYDFQTIALEGEGTIAERVAKILRLLENWQSLLDECDFLYVVLHSQGSVVAVEMLAQLLSNNDIMRNQHRKKIGLLSMSGMFSGPFIGLDTKLIIRAYTAWENEILAEMFELQKPDSKESVALTTAMTQLMRFGNVRVVLCASTSDQFVPLYSALAVQYQHPNIHRILHGDSKTPAFVLTLLKTIVMMKNMGWKDDHGIVREFSDRCMGSIGESGGHAKIYADPDVYKQAVRYILETTSVTNIHHQGMQIIAPAAPIGTNLYLLPWNMRSLMQDLTRVNNIGNLHLIRQLVKEFRNWEPTAKHWREVRYCCDAFSELSVEDLVL